MNISTGIEMLDHILHGGINQGSNVLLISTPGVEDLQFAQQCLFTHLSVGGCGIYLVNNKKPAIARQMLKTFDWDVTEFEKSRRCSFIDCYSGLIGLYPDIVNSVQQPTDLDEIIKVITEFFRKAASPPLLIIDSLSSLIDIGVPEDAITGFMQRIISLAKGHNATIVALFTHWPYSDSAVQSIEGCFDCIVRLKAIEQKVILRSYFSVEKAGWIPELEKKDIPYKVLSPGGVRVFIPKILVTGPFNAGKTSFVHSASIRAVSVDRLGTTVALDHGHVIHKGFAIDLFGTPGQERFDPILRMLGGEALGVIVVVDSTNPSGFARAKDMLKATRTEGLPSVIMANKADMKGALTLEEIRKRMHLPDEVQIVPVVAADLKDIKENQPCRLKKEDVDKVLTTLFERVV